MPQVSTRWKVIFTVLVLAVLAIQAIPYGHPGANPPVLGEPAWDSIETRMLARRACYDCHSNETEWPVYARIAPISWLVTSDVEEGRGKLNFSEWNRPQKEAEEAAEAVAEGEMPLRIYTLMHSHARLTATERALLSKGLANTFRGTPRERAEEHH